MRPGHVTHLKRRVLDNALTTDTIVSVTLYLIVHPRHDVGYASCAFISVSSRAVLASSVEQPKSPMICVMDSSMSPCVGAVSDSTGFAAVLFCFSFFLCSVCERRPSVLQSPTRNKSCTDP